MTESAPPPEPKLPVNLAANPALSSWVRFSSEGHVMVSPGKVEIGQGIVTALGQIAAHAPHAGCAVGHVCAEIRQIFLSLASERLGVGIDALDVKDGIMSGPGNVQTSY